MLYKLIILADTTEPYPFHVTHVTHVTAQCLPRKGEFVLVAREDAPGLMCKVEDLMHDVVPQHNVDDVQCPTTQEVIVVGVLSRKPVEEKTRAFLDGVRSS